MRGGDAGVGKSAFRIDISRIRLVALLHEENMRCSMQATDEQCDEGNTLSDTLRGGGSPRLVIHRDRRYVFGNVDG